MSVRLERARRFVPTFLLDPEWRRRLRLVAFWVPVVACFLIATTPSPGGLVASMSGVVAHTIAFAYLAFALSLAHFRQGPWLPVVIWLVAFGVLIEIVQFFVAGRSAELIDVTVDGIGIAFGALVFAGYRRVREHIAIEGLTQSVSR